MALIVHPNENDRILGAMPNHWRAEMGHYSSGTRTRIKCDYHSKPMHMSTDFHRVLTELHHNDIHCLFLAIDKAMSRAVDELIVCKKFEVVMWTNGINLNVGPSRSGGIRMSHNNRDILVHSHNVPLVMVVYLGETKGAQVCTTLAYITLCTYGPPDIATFAPDDLPWAPAGQTNYELDRS